MTRRPNIILITTDQQRWDCLGIQRHPELVTPTLDQLARKGARFDWAYTPCPVCSPARRSMLTGCTPATDGALDNTAVSILRPDQTLPELLGRSGYQTVEVGRTMHQHPQRRRYGFQVREINPFDEVYSTIHRDVLVPTRAGQFTNWPHRIDHGLPLCGYPARAWPHDERYHQSNIAVNKAIEFLDRRDDAAPFFMHLGFIAPHPPLVPPAFYFDRYRRMDLTPPVIGDWVEPADDDYIGRGAGSSFIPDNESVPAAQAGYYGLINHLDDQLRNFLARLHLVDEPTYILFVSDHGEMLGDHHMFRKSRPFDAATRVPMMLSGPDIRPDIVIDQPVSLIDILPTLCEVAGVDIPSHIEGRSLLPLLAGERGEEWRPFVHGEHCARYDHKGVHYLSNGKTKYIWWSGDGREMLFDLRNDPRECHDLAAEPARGQTLAEWRNRLVGVLRDRPERFVQDERLVPGRPHEPTLPHAARL